MVRRLIILLAAMSQSFGCEMMWNGSTDPPPQPKTQTQWDQEQYDRELKEHMDRQSPDYRQRVRNHEVPG